MNSFDQWIESLDLVILGIGFACAAKLKVISFKNITNIGTSVIGDIDWL